MNIYNLRGNVINNLVNKKQSSGFHSISWNATNNLGQPVSAGMYIYTIQAGDFRETRKMILLK
jgi:flagellar hook assembly protein FlgD